MSLYIYPFFQQDQRRPYEFDEYLIGGASEKLRFRGVSTF